jgi:hypothetical protein
MILPMILYDNFPPYNWGKVIADQDFDKKRFLSWQADYMKWKKTRSIKVKKRLVKKWSKKSRSKYYAKRGTTKRK